MGSVRISEEAVFRWVVIVALAGASIVALTLLTRPLLGALWSLVLVCWAAFHAYRWIERKRKRN